MPKVRCFNPFDLSPHPNTKKYGTLRKVTEKHLLTLDIPVTKKAMEQRICNKCRLKLSKISKDNEILLLTATTAICVSNSMDSTYLHTTNDKSNNNNNIFLAARQRLTQPQQLQREKQRDQQQQFKSLRQNDYQENLKLRNSYVFNNNLEYIKYLQQQQPHQRLQNDLVKAAKPQIKNVNSKNRSKRQSTVKRLLPGEENNSELNEIFSNFPEEKHTSYNAKCNERATAGSNRNYEDLGTTQKENSGNFHEVDIVRRSSLITADADSEMATDAVELDEELPYGIQNVRKRQVHQNREFSRPIKYQSLCPTKRIAIPLETSGYEYRPNTYIEVTCVHKKIVNSFELNQNLICSEVGFSCIQLNRTIHLIRRNKASPSDCWESEVRIVPSGCECMWPRHEHGDITAYHGIQKRFGGYTNIQANSDYIQGEGFRQIQPQQNELFDVNGLRHNVDADGVGLEIFEYSN